MIKISKYTKLGVMVLATLAILVWGINYLKGIDLLKKSSNYYVVYDKIDGLLKSSTITINGYQVGQVTGISFMSDYSGRLLVTLSLQGNFKIAKGSTARIVSSDIMGTKSVKLEIVHSGEYYQPNDTIPGSIESDLKEQVSMQVLPLKKKAEELIASLDSAMTVVTYVFNQKTRENLAESFENINKTVANIESASAELNKIMGDGKINSIVNNVDSITNSIKQNSGNISNIIKNMSALSDSLSKLNVSPVFAQIHSSIAGIDTIIQKLNMPTSSAGLLLNDPALYQNLNSLAGSLDLLLKDVRNNPKRYVHFSAFNMGKDVYITSKPGDVNNKDQIVYKVHLISSPAKLSVESTFFKGLGKIDEMKVSETYSYMAGNTTDFEKISKLLDTARVNFPDANIVAFKNGRKIKIEKALKKRTN
ncbi:MAG: MlaD family protein [Prolixibacteraceae bacterium]|jgi:phospholipid/cholesterol/gamma-HCH transport system substrate-binding protein